MFLPSCNISHRAVSITQLVGPLRALQHTVGNAAAMLLSVNAFKVKLNIAADWKRLYIVTLIFGLGRCNLEIGTKNSSSWCTFANLVIIFLSS